MPEPKRILLVEDNENDAALTLAALEETNLAEDVVVVRDGQEALDFLWRRGRYVTRSGGQPAVVLLDLKMPKVDGLQVLEELKRDAALRVIPVVMLTSSGEHTDLMRSYNLGVNAYVVKPVSFPDYVNALTKIGLFWAVVNQPPPGTVGGGRR